ncbi:MAG TPA: VWA domain-containing protein [Pyrinomonadaceae bacterium]|jgi:VWFA-related protein
MHNRASLPLALVILAILGALSTASSAWAQSAPREKPRLKDFGSSLERLKWDARQNAAVETRRKKKEKERSSDDEEIVRVETSLVVCDVLVLDKQGRIVKGLTPDDFVLTEDGRPQQVGTFSLGDNSEVGRTIVLIIDYSGSQFPFIRTSVAAAKTLVDKLGPRDTMAIVTDDVELLADFTRDKERLKKKLDSLEKSATAGESLNPFSRGRRFGRSAQYSALMATLKEAFDDEDQRPIIIFQTDGDELSFLRNPIISPSIPPNLPPEMQKEAQKSLQRAIKLQHDNMREFSLDDIYAAAEKSRATIYTIIPGFRLIGLTPDEQVKQLNAQAQISMSAWGVKPEMIERLTEREKQLPPEVWQHRAERSLRVQLALAGVAKATGGWTDFLEDPTQADAVYSRIFSDINLRYVIGYYPTNKEHDGKRRRVSIEVRGRPEYTVWGRKSYYAPGPEE